MTSITNDRTIIPNTDTCPYLAEPAVHQSRACVTAPTTPNGAYRDALFSGIPLFTTRLVRERTFDFQTRDQLRSPADAAAVLSEYFEGRDREEFVVAFLDTANTITALHVASVGGLAAAIVEPRQVFKAAVLANAAALVVAHNHPSGNPEPSREDVAVTKQLVEAGKLMGIPVHDHIILAGRGYTSLAERGLM
ncbi:MAG TPA: JAB domain-containing protein [Rubricoccaceae bacterium]|jgi:DNA repair protein RadC